jgi:hypothetical protein
VDFVVWRRAGGVNRFAGRFAGTVRGRGVSARIRLLSAALYRIQVFTAPDDRNAGGSSNVVWVRATP